MRITMNSLDCETKVQQRQLVDRVVDILLEKCDKVVQEKNVGND